MTTASGARFVASVLCARPGRAASPSGTVSGRPYQLRQHSRAGESDRPQEGQNMVHFAICDVCEKAITCCCNKPRARHLCLDCWLDEQIREQEGPKKTLLEKIRGVV